MNHDVRHLSIGVKKQGMSHLVCKTGTEAKPKETKDRPHRSQVQVAPKFYIATPWHKAAFTQRSLCTEQRLTQRSFYA